MPLRGSLRSTTTLLVAAGVTWMACPQAKADEPKPKAENTISIHLGEPVPPQKFEHPPKFWIADVTDRSGNPQPMLVMKDRGEAPNFSRIMINRYGNRTTSKLWSNHESSVIRGSFLTVQLMREYPEGHWDGAKKNASAFQTMKDDLGPVKIM